MQSRHRSCQQPRALQRGIKCNNAELFAIFGNKADFGYFNIFVDPWALALRGAHIYWTPSDYRSPWMICS